MKTKNGGVGEGHSLVNKRMKHNIYIYINNGGAINFYFYFNKA